MERRGGETRKSRCSYKFATEEVTATCTIGKRTINFPLIQKDMVGWGRILSWLGAVWLLLIELTESDDMKRNKPW